MPVDLAGPFFHPVYRCVPHGALTTSTSSSSRYTIYGQDTLVHRGESYTRDFHVIVPSFSIHCLGNPLTAKITSPADLHEKTDLKDNEHLEVLADNEVALTPEQTDFLKKEARVRRKLDLYITPIMLLLQLISYLDRGNIGFAATQGMSKDIGLKGNQLNVSLTEFT